MAETTGASYTQPITFSRHNDPVSPPSVVSIKVKVKPLAYLLVEVVEVAVPVFYCPLMLPVCHFNYINLKHNKSSGFKKKGCV